MDTRLLDEDKVFQICFVTDNLEKSLDWFSELSGKKPTHIGKNAPHDIAKATYNDEPAEFTFRLALFQFGNIDLEFLEPGPEPSTWRDHLDEHGPSFHHFAFRTKNMKKRREFLESKGLKMIQRGEFEKNDGRYAYFDAMKEMGTIIELLEWDHMKDPE